MTHGLGHLIMFFGKIVVTAICTFSGYLMITNIATFSANIYSAFMPTLVKYILFRYSL